MGVGDPEVLALVREPLVAERLEEQVDGLLVPGARVLVELRQLSAFPRIDLKLRSTYRRVLYRYRTMPYVALDISAAGLAELEASSEAAKVDAVVVILCDQPLLTEEVIGQLIVQFQATGQPVVASAYAGTQGVPALFGREIFPQLLELRGAAGARELLQQYAHLPTVDFPGGATDVDTEAQYAALPQ